MSRNLIAGMTDYTHQSLKDILIDLDEWNTNLKETLKTLQQNIEGIKKSEYLQKVDYNFVELISYSMKFYSTIIHTLGTVFR